MSDTTDAFYVPQCGAAFSHRCVFFEQCPDEFSFRCRFRRIYGEFGTHVECACSDAIRDTRLMKRSSSYEDASQENELLRPMVRLLRVRRSSLVEVQPGSFFKERAVKILLVGQRDIDDKTCSFLLCEDMLFQRGNRRAQSEAALLAKLEEL